MVSLIPPTLYTHLSITVCPDIKFSEQDLSEVVCLMYIIMRYYVAENQNANTVKMRNAALVYLQ